MFDPSAPHIIILLIVVLLLFGSSRLPGAANALGKSMHIFKRSVQGFSTDDQDSAANPSAPSAVVPPPPLVTAVSVPPAVPAADPTQQQLADLQRQVAELQRQNSAGNGQSEQTQTPQHL